MKTWSLALIALVCCTSIVVFGYPRLAQAGDGAAAAGTDTGLVETCIAPAQSYGGKTISQWRAEGPEGLAELMEQLEPTIQAYRKAKTPEVFVEPADISDTDRANLLLLDQVAQQRDAYAAGLYWYTDLDEALKQAENTGKPILSLRMLGKLVDEYSCANSRFFRTVLYADQSIAEMLRDKFVLHWQSVRPVPVITIDMGDGRTIKRTITGNSAHYILDPNGRVIDCLPGLYGPDTFERMVAEAGVVATELSDTDDKVFIQAVQARHAGRASELDRAWARYMQTLAAEEAGQVLSQTLNASSTKRNAMPDARTAGRIAIAGKFRVESPLIDAVLPQSAPTASQAADDEALWKRIGEAYANEARLDEGSRSLMAIKAPRESMESAMRRALSKTRIESPLARMVRSFEGGLAVETARNEHLLRRQLHDWFAQAKAPLDLDALNKRVYAELFLTPDEDPWLGLVPADTYSALDAGGLIEVNNQSAQR